MAAPRASSLKALRNLQKASSSIPASQRSLHMTERHAAPRMVDPLQKSTFMSMGLQALQSEARRRTLSATGTKHELIDRITGHDALQARAFSIAMRRIASEQTKKTISA